MAAALSATLRPLGFGWQARQELTGRRVGLPKLRGSAGRLVMPCGTSISCNLEMAISM